MEEVIQEIKASIHQEECNLIEEDQDQVVQDQEDQDQEDQDLVAQDLKEDHLLK